MGFALSMTGGALADAGQWNIVASTLNTGVNGIVSAVACAGTTCWAVGGPQSYIASQPGPALLEGNTGNGWFIANDPSPLVVNSLNAVTCVDAGDCWAVGDATPDRTLIEHYSNGGWTYEPSPALPPEATLNGVACTSLTDCWAVGGDGPSGAAGHTLVEHYDGTRWIVVSSSNSSPNDFLNSVSCPAANDCWAVGDNNTDALFVEHYDGTAWTVDTALAAVGTNNNLSGVTCVSAAECWAVGWQGNPIASFTQTVIERYNGDDWSTVSSPNPLGGSWGVNFLKGVSCDSNGVCWAVGQSTGVEGYNAPGQSLIAEYTGSGDWTAVANPDPGLSGDNFNGVGCGSAACVAGGSGSNGPLLAQGPLGQESKVGTTGGAASLPPPGLSTTSGDPAVPDTGGAGTPWAALAIAGGLAAVITGFQFRRRRLERPTISKV